VNNITYALLYVKKNFTIYSQEKFPLRGIGGELIPPLLPGEGARG
jgi:hypothetical protein